MKKVIAIIAWVIATIVAIAYVFLISLSIYELIQGGWNNINNPDNLLVGFVVLFLWFCTFSDIKSYGSHRSWIKETIG